VLKAHNHHQFPPSQQSTSVEENEDDDENEKESVCSATERSTRACFNSTKGVSQTHLPTNQTN